jgi:hypothetical protein
LPEVVLTDIYAFSQFGYASVARGAIDLVDRLALRQFPYNSVLSSSATDNQYLHPFYHLTRPAGECLSQTLDLLP